MTTLTNMKFRISSLDQSRELQEVLFKLGYRWLFSKTEAVNTDRPYLYVYTDADITFGEDQYAFMQHRHPEMSTDEFIAKHTASKFVAQKFKYANPDQAGRLQDKLFREGYKWASGVIHAQYTDDYGIHTTGSGKMWRETSQNYFDSQKYPETDTAKYLGEPPERRPHADLIIAWANGAKIQRETQTNVWRDDNSPIWLENVNYRIVPDAVFPKTSISSTDLYDIYATGTGKTNGEDLEQTVNYALEKFVESGELAAYVKAHGVDGKGGAQ